MKISDRFTDYGLIGGFFWLVQIGFWCLVKGTSPIDLMQSVATIFGPLPVFTVSLLGAFGLILVFVTGVVLDILGSFLFQNIEVNVFGDLARQHSTWFEQIVERSKNYIRDDFEVIKTAPTTGQLFRAYYWRWGKTAKDLRLQIPKNKDAGPRRPACVRLHSFLIAYVTLSAGSDKLDVIGAQMSMWKDVRAIATALLLSALEVILLIPLTRHLGLLTLFLILGIEIILSYGALFISSTSYRNVCDLLFALVYIVNERSSANSR